MYRLLNRSTKYKHGVENTLFLLEIKTCLNYFYAQVPVAICFKNMHSCRTEFPLKWLGTNIGYWISYQQLPLEQHTFSPSYLKSLTGNAWSCKYWVREDNFRSYSITESCMLNKLSCNALLFALLIFMDILSTRIPPHKVMVCCTFINVHGD